MAGVSREMKLNHKENEFPCFRRTDLTTSLVYFRINRPGGHGKVCDIHLNPAGDRVESLDIKYTIEKSLDRMVAVEWIEPHAELERGGRSRRRVEVASAHPNPQPATNKRQRNKSITAKPKTTAAALKKKVAAQEVTLPAEEDAFPSDIYAYDDDSSSVVSELSEGPIYQAVVSARSLTTGMSKTDVKPEAIIDYKPPAVEPAIARAKSLGSGGFQLSPSRNKKTLDISNVSYKNVQSPACPSKQVTLGEVYAFEVQQARQFMDQVILHNEPVDQVQEPMETSREASPAFDVLGEERIVFERLFYELLVDEGDGEIEENVVRGRINALAQQRDLAERYDEAKVAEYIDNLCLQNRIMRSDGNLYNI